MQRDLRQLQASFDILVVGAGIYGAAIAWDATLRGLRVALIDRNDFGSGTSFNNAKTLHGGVRSLQRGHLRELREYVDERRAMMRIVPHLVQPRAFLAPTYRSATRNRLAIGAYFALYDQLARHRNEGVDPARHLDASRVISRQECLERNPVVEPDGLTGGVLWQDGQMLSGERTTLAFITAAARGGAVVANYVEAEGFMTGGRVVTGVHARDRRHGDSFDIRARLTINASGPLADRLIEPLLGPSARMVPALSLAMNLVTKRRVSETAVGGFARGRLFFLAPWRDVMIAGTSHDTVRGRPDPVQVATADTAALLADLNAAFPRARLTPDDVLLVHRGLLPARQTTPTVKLLTSSIIRDHEQEGWTGLMSVVGVRYTTARHTAQLAVDAAAVRLGHVAPCRTATTPLTGGDVGSIAGLLASAAIDQPPFANDTRLRVAHLYGTEWVRLGRLALENPGLVHPIGTRCQTTGAELVFAVREEMALTLADAVLRRTDAGTAGHPGRDALVRAADVLGRELDWDETRKAQEIAEVEQAYVVP